MLSFDITDKQIKIVRGADVRGKIKITSALTVPVSEGLIVNGHIKDIPQMATVINNAMKDNKLMGEKEAVISLSSNLMVFKEVPIPKVKPSQIRQMVVTQMQQQMGVTNEYSIAYTIAGDDEGGKGGTKVLLLPAQEI